MSSVHVSTTINGDPIFHSWKTLNFETFTACRQYLYHQSPHLYKSLYKAYETARRVSVDCYEWKAAWKLQQEYLAKEKQKAIFAFLNSQRGKKQVCPTRRRSPCITSPSPPTPLSFPFALPLHPVYPLLLRLGLDWNSCPLDLVLNFLNLVCLVFSICFLP